MKRAWVIGLLGLALGVGAYGVLYRSWTAPYRSVQDTAGPELSWLKKEFNLSDPDFARIKTLHEAYKPVCAEMCRKVDADNEALSQLLSASTNVTPEIESRLAAIAQLRRECQTQMLKHFFAVSQAMPPEQGRRYLLWMQEQTLAPSHSSMVPQASAAALDEHHHH